MQGSASVEPPSAAEAIDALYLPMEKADTRSDNAAYMNYLAQQLAGEGGYGELLQASAPSLEPAPLPEPTTGSPTIKAMASLALDFVPVAGQLKAMDELWTGRDRLLNVEVNRGLSALALIPGGKLAAKTVQWLGKTRPVMAAMQLTRDSKVIESAASYSKQTVHFLTEYKGVIAKHTLNAAVGGTSSFLSALSTADAHPWRSAVIGAGASFIFGFKSPATFKNTIRLGAVAGAASNSVGQVIEKFGENKTPISVTKIGVAAYAGGVTACLTYGMPLIPAAIVSFGPSTVINKLGDVFYERWYNSTK
ncbi:hypothetical protein [Legionella fairfieldensis]|uniref:hypothetical protein n=2 Tax=Legionella fairfieldensis TaxID=45064 RepID=UPI0010418E1A|nr:hypothetical protein [Legionella fairfieldensis]